MMRCNNSNPDKITKDAEMIKESNKKAKKESVIGSFKGLVRDDQISPEEAASRAGVLASI